MIMEIWTAPAMVAGALIALVGGIGAGLWVRTPTEKRRAERKELDEQIAAGKVALKALENETQALRAETKGLEQLEAESERIRTEHAGLEKQREALRAWEEEELRRVEAVEGKRRAAEDAEELEARIGRLEARKAALEEAAEKQRKETEAAEAEWKEISTKLEGAEQIWREVEEARRKLKETKNAIELGAVDLRELADGKGKLETEIKEAKTAKSKALKDKEVAENGYAKARETLEGMERSTEALRREKDGLTTGNAALEVERRRLTEAEGEARRRHDQAAAHAEDQKRQLGELEKARTKKEAEVERLSRQVEERKKKEQGLTGELAELEGERRRLAEATGEARRQHDQAATQAENLKSQVRELKEARVKAEAEVQRLTQQAKTLTEQVEEREKKDRWLTSEVSAMEQRKKGLENELKDMSVTIDTDYTSSGAQDDGSSRFGNLKTWSKAGPRTAGTGPEESKALEEVVERVKEQGLKFRTRVIHRFHTSLKTARISPLTVLAGISGTGKTQLPRAYARAMGMECLVVPVQPRWDSPRDLLGHFDFLHQRFQATDLGRLLWEYSDIEDEGDMPKLRGTDDRMALVLLDEMNLARTEHYFSEFLSRLELQVTEDEVEGKHIDRERMVELDIPYRNATKAVRVFPTQRVLWAGTMNEDESTMTLSDKVIDRSNILRFARPKLKDGTEKGQYAAKPQEGPRVALCARTWNGWLERKNEMGKSEELVERINQEVMAGCGHSYGFRGRNAMLHYVRCYSGRTWQEAMGDMVEMRVLPKLQGTDGQRDEASQSILKLAKICRDDLNDAPLAASIEDAEGEMQQTGTFTWSGRELEGDNDGP